MSAPASSSTSPPPGLRARLGLALVAGAIALGLCELGARLVFPRPPDASRQPQVAYVRDPEIRYVPAPSQQGWIDDGLVTVNSLGARGREVATPKPHGRLRVVVIGDSLTLGWGVADDETYAAQLERALREQHPGRDLDVVNLGVGGYNTRQSVTWLARHAARLAPDLVLLGFYSNDVPDALEGAESGTRIAAGPAAPGQLLRINPTPNGWWDRQLRKSRAVYVAGRAFNRMRGAGEWGMSRFAMEIDMLEGRSSPDVERAWALVGGQFRRLRALAAEHGFEVGVILLPCREQVMGQYPDAAFQKKVRALVEPLGFRVIDPLPLLVEQRTGTPDLYIPYDRNHPSARGHRIIGEAAASQLTNQGLVASPATRPN